jgi:dirigent-like protein
MMRKLTVGLIATAFLLSGALVGVSFAGGGGIEQPEVIELSFDLCGTKCRGYELRDPVFGHGKGLITLSKDPISDGDGNTVGHQNQSCVVSGSGGKGTDWVCTYVITLTDGPHTESGTIVTTGLYRFDGPTAFAVTGGTGAYANVRGYATLDSTGDQVMLTLNLTP